jgi:hypothetical protein
MAKKKKTPKDIDAATGTADDQIAPEVVAAIADALEPAQDIDVSEPFESEIPPPEPRMTGEELKAMLRQQRREARLAEKGY